MKGFHLKILLSTSILFTCFSSHVAATALPDRGSNISGNFTMLDASGNLFGGTNDIVFDWDNTVNTSEFDTNFNMSISSEGSQPFFGATWLAHHIRVFGEGTYIFETDNTKCSVTDIETTGCPGDGGSTSMTMTVGNGQLGTHILLDYNLTLNIDIVNVWDVNDTWADEGGIYDPLNNIYTGPAGIPPVLDAPFALVSRDANGDGINGMPMIDGTFKGFSANFNAPLPEGDYDYDGVPDEFDNCKFYSNLDQVDSDSDGVGDRCDFPDSSPQQVSSSGNISILFSIVIALFVVATRRFNMQQTHNKLLNLTGAKDAPPS